MTQGAQASREIAILEKLFWRRTDSSTNMDTASVEFIGSAMVIGFNGHLRENPLSRKPDLSREEEMAPL